jgi:hypothetical protein
MNILGFVEEAIKDAKINSESRELYRYLIIDMKDGKYFFAKHGETVMIPPKIKAWVKE